MVLILQLRCFRLHLSGLQQKSFLPTRTSPLVHLQCGCHVSLEIASIAYHGFLVLLNWLCLGITTCDAMNGKNHYGFHSFLHSLNNCQLSKKKDPEGTTWQGPWTRFETRRVMLQSKRPFFSLSSKFILCCSIQWRTEVILVIFESTRMLCHLKSLFAKTKSRSW